MCIIGKATSVVSSIGYMVAMSTYSCRRFMMGDFKRHAMIAKHSHILNKSENATPELFAILYKIMQTKTANESVY